MTDPLGSEPLGTYGSPEQVRATVAAQVSAADARIAAVDRLAADVKAATGTARSPRGEVEVTADSSAVVTSVRHADDALELGADELGRMLADTIAKAQAAASERALVLTAEALGEESPLTLELRAEVESRQSRAHRPGDGPVW
jgi:hypothetical protein